MNASMFLAGMILLFLLICQFYKVYEADKEYKETLEEYKAQIRRKNAKNRV